MGKGNFKIEIKKIYKYISRTLTINSWLMVEMAMPFTYVANMVTMNEHTR